MALVLPAAELKVTGILKTESGITISTRVFRLDDGGLDEDGNQLYARTLKFERTFTVPPHWTKQQILDAAIERLKLWAIQAGFNLPPDRRVCSL